VRCSINGSTCTQEGQRPTSTRSVTQEITASQCDPSQQLRLRIVNDVTIQTKQEWNSGRFQQWSNRIGINVDFNLVVTEMWCRWKKKTGLPFYTWNKKQVTVFKGNIKNVPFRTAYVPYDSQNKPRCGVSLSRMVSTKEIQFVLREVGNGLFRYNLCFEPFCNPCTVFTSP